MPPASSSCHGLPLSGKLNTMALPGNERLCLPAGLISPRPADQCTISAVRIARRPQPVAVMASTALPPAYSSLESGDRFSGLWTGYLLNLRCAVGKSAVRKVAKTYSVLCILSLQFVCTVSSIHGKLVRNLQRSIQRFNTTVDIVLPCNEGWSHCQMCYP